MWKKKKKNKKFKDLTTKEFYYISTTQHNLVVAITTGRDCHVGINSVVRI